jgi:hypothetical protein
LGRLRGWDCIAASGTFALTFDVGFDEVGGDQPRGADASATPNSSGEPAASATSAQVPDTADSEIAQM